MITCLLKLGLVYIYSTICIRSLFELDVNICTCTHMQTCIQQSLIKTAASLNHSAVLQREIHYVASGLNRTILGVLCITKILFKTVGTDWVGFNSTYICVDQKPRG